ncbi:MAG TPA: response regulator transcription factor [Candidatus Acidoferrales bacterium]|nr:response regulator transcription factor [Candidatus Acidoferrales bacterium]
MTCLTLDPAAVEDAVELGDSRVKSRPFENFGEGSVIFSREGQQSASWQAVKAGYTENNDGRKAFRILIADDHEAVRRGLKSALAGAGWVVCGEAVDGRDAIQKAKDLKPDLIILDVTMPNLGGLDAAREILKDGDRAKILIFTMHESRQIREETAALGVHALAVKSAPLSTLLATIDSLLIHTH